MPPDPFLPCEKIGNARLMRSRVKRLVSSVCMCIYTMYVYNYVTKKTAVLYLDSHKPSQKLILLARKIYMLPKILSIASELSIERRSRIFLLRDAGPYNH